MLLTAAQTTVFFEDAAQMGIPNATVVQLQVEGIVSVDDLADFDKDTASSRLLLTYAVLRKGYMIRTLERLQVRRFRLHLLCLERNPNSD
jgi:hypothetical protein